MRVVAFALLIACTTKAPHPPSGAASSGGSASPRAYGGPADRGPCSDAHGCKLRSNCGCSCEGVALSAPSATDCDESCNNPDVCEGYAVICDVPTETCGAIPPAPKS